MNKRRHHNKRHTLLLKHETIARLTEDVLKHIVGGDTSDSPQGSGISYCRPCQTG